MNKGNYCMIFVTKKAKAPTFQAGAPGDLLWLFTINRKNG